MPNSLNIPVTTDQSKVMNIHELMTLRISYDKEAIQNMILREEAMTVGTQLFKATIVKAYGGV